MSYRFFHRVFLALVLFVLVGSTLFGFLLYRRLAVTTLDTLKSDLQKETETLAGIAHASPEILQDPKTIIRAVHTADRITIISPAGVVLGDNWAEILHKEVLENHSDRPEVIAAMHNAPIFIQRFSKTIQQELLYYAVPVRNDQGIVFVIRLSFALTTYFERLAQIRNFLLLIGLASAFLSLPAAYVLSRMVTRQLDELRGAANRIASGELSIRIHEEGSVEFRELASDFNQMAQELSGKIQAIRQQHTQTEILLSQMVEGVLAVDRGGKAVFANQAFCKMFGLKEDRVQGKSMLEMVRNDQLSDFISTLLRDKQSPESREVRILTPDGDKTFYVQSSRIQETTQDGSLLLVFHDITDAKRLEMVRRDFVANVSHELRTPLTALIGSTEILLDGLYLKPEESRKFLEIMDKQLRNIENLVSDMLRLAAVEDARTPFRREETALESLLEDITAQIKLLALKKEQVFRMKLPDHSVTLNVDAGQISAALINLLDNAVKYTPEKGVIELSVTTTEKTIRIVVKDNGPGIPREVQPRIFERFYRIDKSRSREMGGTGLGLAIARHAVENHGGTLTVQSAVGQGATFTIELPN